MVQDKKKKGTAEDLMLPTPEISGDPMLEGTGQLGELFGTPEQPNQLLLDDMQEQETGIPQDPMLKGTGQPGELYGTPEKPSNLIIEELEKEAKDNNKMSYKDFIKSETVTPAQFIHDKQMETVYNMRRLDFEKNLDTYNFDYYMQRLTNTGLKARKNSDKESY